MAKVWERDVLELLLTYKILSTEQLYYLLTGLYIDNKGRSLLNFYLRGMAEDGLLIRHVQKRVQGSYVSLSLKGARVVGGVPYHPRESHISHALFVSDVMVAYFRHHKEHGRREISLSYKYLNKEYLIAPDIELVDSFIEVDRGTESLTMIENKILAYKRYGFSHDMKPVVFITSGLEGR